MKIKEIELMEEISMNPEPLIVYGTLVSITLSIKDKLKQ